ncbi:MAG TPA: hypothetical protein VFG05_01635 [Methylocella sp.]|nr:hypothetical protein [Methylocella sp.]
MAKDLKKFVNPKFLRTVDLVLLRQLLDRHRAVIKGLEFEIFDHNPADARRAIQDFFAGPDENYPDGLVADLHRIADLGNSTGLQVILEQAVRLGVSIAPEKDEDGSEERQDPKHVALRIFLDHPSVFDAASDMLALIARTSLAEFAGQDEGVEAVIGDKARAAFEKEAAAMFEADLRGRYCRVGWYEDDGEVNLVIAHGSTVTTAEVIEGTGTRVACFRPAEHAVLSYSASSGRLKVGGVAKARRAGTAELFANKILQRPGFFAAADAQNLYTLDPVQRAGFGFSFNHAFDPGIQRVQITEVQVDRVGADPRSGETRSFHSYVARDGRDNALARLGEMMRGIPLGSDWRLNHMVIRVHFATSGARPAKVTVKLKPPASAMFKRHRFENRIMTLLRRNGLVHERDPGAAAVAAE